MRNEPEYRHVATIVGIVAVVAALYFAKAVLILLAVAGLLAFLLAPLARRLEHIGLPRVASVGLIVVMTLGCLGGIGWLIAGETTQFIEKLPQYRGNLRDKFQSVQTAVRRPIERATQTVRDLAHEADASSPSGGHAPVVRVAEDDWLGFRDILTPAGEVFSFLASAGVVVLLVAVMLLRRDGVRDRLIGLTGGRHLYVTTLALDEAASKVSRYLVLTSLLNGSFGLAVGLGLSLLGVPNAALWGFLAAVLRFVPYVGPWVAAAFPTAVALAVFPGWTTPALVVAMFLALELVSNNIIEPWVYGSRTGVSPGALILAAIFWTWIWGAAGLLVATPLTVCLAVLGKYVPPLRFLHVILGDEPVLAGDERLYQRLLAHDVDGGAEIVIDEARATSPLSAYERLVIPALARAERDRHAGDLDPEAMTQLAMAMQEIVDETEDAVTATADSPPTDASRPRIPMLCIAAQDVADQVVAEVAARRLAPLGYDPRVVSTEVLTGELPVLVRRHRAQMVLISNIPPSGFAHVRYVCKRLAACGDIPIVVGIWGASLDAERARNRLPEVSTVKVVSTMTDALECARQLHAALTLKAPAPSPEASAPSGTRAPAIPQRTAHESV